MSSGLWLGRLWSVAAGWFLVGGLVVGRRPQQRLLPSRISGREVDAR